MRETRADTRRAVAGALALHALLFALMFAGLWWTRMANPVAAAGPVIEADLIDPDALAAPLLDALDEPAEVPVPAEPPPEPARPDPIQPRDFEPPDIQREPQEFIPEPDPVEQERVEREAEAARQAAREQEEKRRQEQIDLTERKRQEEAERQKRLAEQKAREAEQKRIARELEKVRAEREKAEREARLAQQRLQQIKDAQARSAASTAAPPPGAGDTQSDSDLGKRYAAALQAAILRNWTRPESVPLGQRCKIVIRQAVGGIVVDAKVDPSCPYDELGRRSVEAAVLKAEPLPYAGFESVFNRTLILNFEAQDQ